MQLLNLSNDNKTWLSQVSSKFGVYKFLIFNEILVHSFKPPILDYTNRVSTMLSRLVILKKNKRAVTSYNFAEN
jgi:hypothetical protein